MDEKRKIRRLLQGLMVKVHNLKNLSLRYSCLLSLVLALCIVLTIGSAREVLALDQSKLPEGANHERAHSAPHKSTGKDIPIGIIELNTINAQHNLGARLKAEWSFVGKKPSNPIPTDNSAAGGDHTTLVADIAAGNNGNYVGVAKEAWVYSAAIDTAPIDTPDSFRAAVDWMYTPRNAAVDTWKNHPSIALFNNSWGPGYEMDDNGDNQLARFVDYYARTKDVLFVGVAGNNAEHTNQRINEPWDAFNGITVGTTDANFKARKAWSQYLLSSDDGSEPDWRGKPDILAPGDEIGDGKSFSGGESSGTSFAAPHVTGVAALLAAGTEKLPDGLPLGNVGECNHLAQKAIILNSARKRHINGPEANHPHAEDYQGGYFWDHDSDAATPNLEVPRTDQQPSDSDYLTAGGKLRAGGTPGDPKTAEWTPSKWSSDGTKLTVLRPLDDEQGTGVLDAERSLIQYDGGEQEEKAQNPGGIRPIGWNREPLSADFGTDIYEFNFPISQGTFITASLVWDRVIEEFDGDNIVEDTDTYVDSTDGLGFLPDFDLFFYYEDTLLASSIGIGNSLFGQNVEHLHYPVPYYGDPFDYSIRVDLSGSGNDHYDYALAWWTTPVPEPGTYLLVATGLFGLTFMRRRLSETKKFRFQKKIS